MTGRGTLKVGGAGEVDFNNSATGWLPVGDDITNDGIIKLHNTESIKLYYEPTITNNSDGVISIDVSNAQGLILNTGDTVRDILNSGEIVAQIPSGNAYNIADPIYNQNGANPYVESGELRFEGQDPTTNFTFVQQGGSTYIWVGATLTVDYGLWQNTMNGGGLIEAYISGSGAGPPSTVATATLAVNYSNQKILVDAGSITVGGAVITTSAVQLNIKLAPLVWNAGTANFYYDVGRAHSTYLTCSQGNSITIGKTNTTVSETVYDGSSPIPVINVMQVTLASISNLAANNPAGFTASLTNGATDYTLTPNSAAFEAGDPDPSGGRPASGVSLLEALAADGQWLSLAPWPVALADWEMVPQAAQHRAPGFVDRPTAGLPPRAGGAPAIRSLAGGGLSAKEAYGADPATADVVAQLAAPALGPLGRDFYLGWAVADPALGPGDLWWRSP